MKKGVKDLPVAERSRSHRRY